MSDEQTQSIAASNERFLCFTLGEEKYAIPLLSVKEVIAIPEMTKIPNAPAYFLGIMNLRGLVISVIDLRTKFSIKPLGHNETAIIICEIQGVNIGVMVDSINYVFSPEEGSLTNKPDMPASKTAEAITAIYRHDKELVIILDLAKAVNVDDITKLRNTKAA